MMIKKLSPCYDVVLARKAKIYSFPMITYTQLLPNLPSHSEALHEEELQALLLCTEMFLYIKNKGKSVFIYYLGS